MSQSVQWLAGGHIATELKDGAAGVRGDRRTGRVLIAWELGANFGHLIRCLAIAQQLRRQGHSVLLAVRDTRGAAELLSAADMPFVQAPLSNPTRPPRPPASYTEILLAQGYHDAVCVRGLTHAWHELFRLWKTDVVLADHAPTALLASQLAELPAVAIGNGFAVPPAVTPLPSIRPWEAIAEARLLEADRLVDRTLARVCGHFRQTPIRLAQLFNRNALLDTFPELDHFGPRPNGNYIGPIFGIPGGLRVRWQGTGDTRIIAYLRPATTGLQALLTTLQVSDAETLAVIPGLAPDQARRFAGRRLRIASGPVDFSGLLSEADLTISNGGTATLAETLLEGIPQLVVPHFVEQHLVGERVQALGAGLSLGTDRQENVFFESLAQLTGGGEFRAAAGHFATRHSGFQPRMAAAKAVAALELPLVEVPVSTRPHATGPGGEQ